MKRLLLVAAAGAALAGCGGPPAPDHGIVLDRNHSAAYDSTTMICASYGKYGCQVWIPITDHHREAWSLKLRLCKGDKCHTGWHGVNEAEYDAYFNGNYYPRGQR